MKLFYTPGACSLAPHVVLHWTGASYEAVRAGYGSPELLAVNSAGAVPVLDTGEGWILTQAGAILHYLARRFPEAELGPDPSVRGAAEFDRWSSFFTGDLHPAFFPLFSPGRYTAAKDAAAQDRVRQAAWALVARRLALLDEHLTGQPFILGERRTVLDAYALPMLRWAVAKLPEGLSDYPSVQGHLNRMSADLGVKEVIAEEEAA